MLALLEPSHVWKGTETRSPARAEQTQVSVCAHDQSGAEAEEVKAKLFSLFGCSDIADIEDKLWAALNRSLLQRVSTRLQSQHHQQIPVSWNSRKNFFAVDTIFTAHYSTTRLILNWCPLLIGLCPTDISTFALSAFSWAPAWPLAHYESSEARGTD